MNYDTIKPYIEKGFISEQRHPKNQNVAIFNYTQKCQFERAWDDVTRSCRGLIVDVRDWNIIARPFPKFFNYQEHVAHNLSIPQEHPEVYEKLDGSLGILYWVDGVPWIATRGSFMSDQAQWATQYMRTYIDKMGLVDDEYTHLFEIIYPQNRIVVSYDYSDLVYLTSIDKATGATRQFDYPFRKAKKIDIDNVENLLKLDEPNSEGFVLFYPDANVRMKIKFPEYVRLHKLITGVSEIAIWEHMRDGKSLDDLLTKVPDEFFSWVTQVQRRLREEYSRIEMTAKLDYDNVKEQSTPEWQRKEYALAIQKKDTPGILFAMLDGKDYQHIIWKMVRPHGQSAFKVDIDS